MEKKRWVVSMMLAGADEGRFPNGRPRLIPREFDAKNGDLFCITAAPAELEEMFANNGWTIRGLVWESDDHARFEGTAIHSRFEVRRED